MVVTRPAAGAQPLPAPDGQSPSQPASSPGRRRWALAAALAIFVAGQVLLLAQREPPSHRPFPGLAPDSRLASDGPGPCPGMLCAGSCRPRRYGCNVIVRSQMRDRCNAIPAGVGCGPRKPGPDLAQCEVGVVNRVLVDAPGDCTEARFRSITEEGCAAYRKKNAGRPLDEFDPSRDIQVTRRFERYDAEGNLIDEPGIGEYRCPRPPRRPQPRRSQPAPHPLRRFARAD
jgi:hypothetical protein